MDTIVRECIICREEGDCIEGICSQCASEDDLTHYMSATSRLSEKLVVLQAENKRLRRENINLAEDLNYHKAILDGSWPSSRLILEEALKGVKDDNETRR